MITVRFNFDKMPKSFTTSLKYFLWSEEEANFFEEKEVEEDLLFESNKSADDDIDENDDDDDAMTISRITEDGILIDCDKARCC